MKTAIVTGAAGFMGSHLVDKLVAEGYFVAAIDNLSTGTWDNLEQHGPEHVLKLTWDITEYPDETILPLSEVDVVIHLASAASPVHYRRLALETLRVNSIGTENALKLAKRYHARFVLGSTSEVYGDPQISPQVESYWGHVNPNGVRACYDEGKRYGEAIAMEYHRQFGIDLRILRFFNCYGPRMQSEDGRVVPNFVRQALEGQALTVYGDGMQTRSFCYVSDEVAGIYAAATREGLAGEVFNIGNPEERTIMNFAQAVAKAGGVPLHTEFRPLPPDDPTNRCPDITKAQTLLGWSPKVSLEEGLEKTFAYFRSKI
ncbi:MAG: NAD-dependent dehydratase [Sulfobacillus thermosulfidooxidans]|uniref:NAD-dependent epimerase/dehydratase family protein n=2 Tax=Sulfobacillus TaxID=28033 RepID=UPI000CD29554|nr:NAD-dependent epimerase/dehydratase family protein [Sulfobacillus sp. hq2]POB10324.1 NAD-dependent dehydratase [Sulfobacillus sp. hq2]PSR36786.1 MAG: NAD-dependent dehydratase [Sulfobacillus thermosulfidooxidans]